MTEREIGSAELHQPEPGEPGLTRRSFLRGSLGAAGGLTAIAAALSPLRELDTGDFTVEKFLQKHYKEMTREDMDRVLAHIRDEVEERYRVRPEIRDIKPQDGVEFVYALHLGRCIGCRKCVHACVAEKQAGRGEPKTDRRAEQRRPGVRADERDRACCHGHKSVTTGDDSTHPQDGRGPEKHGGVMSHLGRRDWPDSPRETTLKGERLAGRYAGTNQDEAQDCPHRHPMRA